MNKDQINAHNAGVQQMYERLLPIVAHYDSGVVLNTLLITLAACGAQTAMPAEHFKALVIQELDRLMLVDAKPGRFLS